VGNYVIANPYNLGNFMIADTQNFNIITDTGMLREFLELDAVSGESQDHDDETERATSSAGSADGTPSASPTGTPSETASMPSLTSSGPAAPASMPAAGGLPVGWLIGLPALGALAGAVAVWIASRGRFGRRAASGAGDCGRSRNSPGAAIR